MKITSSGLQFNYKARSYERYNEKQMTSPEGRGEVLVYHKGVKDSYSDKLRCSMSENQRQSDTYESTISQVDLITLIEL